jgi:hypothetical protein
MRFVLWYGTAALVAVGLSLGAVLLTHALVDRWDAWRRRGRG